MPLGKCTGLDSIRGLCAYADALEELPPKELLSLYILVVEGGARNSYVCKVSRAAVASLSPPSLHVLSFPSQQFS
jgi:hypothetical protein